MIDTVHLLPVLDEKLLRLLRSLKVPDWEKKATPNWTVKDVAAHLLDGNIRTLSSLRDGYFGLGRPKSDSYEDVLAFINDFNSKWSTAAKRISPALLIELLEITGRQHNDYYASIPLHATATFAVGWAGEQQSKNWFHLAREYTEKWHHQQQIRAALNCEQDLYAPKLYRPFLETGMYAFPHHYRAVKKPGAVLKIRVDGKAGGDWFISCADQWTLERSSDRAPDAEIHIPAEAAWRLLTKALEKSEAKKLIRTSGDPELTEPAFSVLAVMA